MATSWVRDRTTHTGDPFILRRDVLDVIEAEIAAGGGGGGGGGTAVQLMADAVGSFAIGSYSGLPTTAQADGVVMVDGMTILLVSEALSVNNGLWEVSSGSWSRPDEYDTGFDAAGSLVVIRGGDQNGGTLWTVNGATPRTVDTNGTTWVPLRGRVDRGIVNAFSLYYPGDLVVVSANGAQIRVLITKPIQASGAAFISSANYVVTEYLTNFDARRYGTLSATTGSETPINAALTGANSAGGGMVRLPGGTYAASGTVVPKYYTGLEGQGMLATLLVIVDNTNASVLKPFVSTGSGVANSAFVSFRNFGVNGRKATQTSGHGIEYTTNPLTSAQTGTSVEWFDPHVLFENLAVRSCKQDGIHLTGRSAHHLKNVWCQNNDGIGFSLTFDTTLFGCEAEGSGQHGFYLNNGSIRLSGCKSYLNGSIDGTGAGFYLGSNCSGAALAGCDAQNNRGPGFYLDGAHDCVVQGTADGNGHKTGGSPTSGVILNNARNNIIDVACLNQPQGGVEIGDQNYALKITGTSTGNTIRLTCSATAPANILGLIDPASTSIAGNTIIVNGVDLTQELSTLTDVSISSPSNGQVLTYDSGSGTWQNSSAGGTSFMGGIFGDGTDGAADLDGVNTVSWATLSGGTTYTMTRDCHCTTLSVHAGITVVPRNCRIFATVSIANDGTIQGDGTSGTSTAGGAANTSVAGALLRTGNAGGAGGTSAAGTVGQGGGIGLGNAGGGGAGSTTAGGTGGGATSSVTVAYRTPFPVLTGWMGPIQVLGGGGGGGGGGDNTNRGGGGGGGGNVLALLSPSIINTGTLSSRGGAGFTPATGNCGGGGGGAGGVIVAYTASAWTVGTTQVTGGTAGSGVGTGTAGTAGGNGNVLNVVVV